MSIDSEGKKFIDGNVEESKEEIYQDNNPIEKIDSDLIVQKKRVNVSKKKHYKPSFNDNWIIQGKEAYKDWITRVQDDPKKFLDLACNKVFDCEYLAEHERTKTHIEAYNAWKSLDNNKKIDEDITLSRNITLIQSKIILFLLKKNAPLSWASDIESLMKSCFPQQKEVNYLNMYDDKNKWIAHAIADSNQQTLHNLLKEKPYSLHYDETSNKYYKYGLFLVRRINENFCDIENLILNLHDVGKCDAASLYKFYETYILEKNLEGRLTSICLDNCNVMRGKSNSFMTKVLEKKPFLSMPPCLIHIFNICERDAFTNLPNDIERFYRSIYSYFSRSLQRVQAFQSLQKKLGVSPTLLNHHSYHSRDSLMKIFSVQIASELKDFEFQ